jgi:hypothetical protein
MTAPVTEVTYPQLHATVFNPTRVTTGLPARTDEVFNPTQVGGDKSSYTYQRGV